MGWKMRRACRDAERTVRSAGTAAVFLLWCAAAHNPPLPLCPRRLPHHLPQVDMHLYHSLGGHEKLLASATGIFKKLGALRAL